MIFEPEKAEIFQIAKKKKSYNSFIFKFLRGIIWILGFLAIILWLIHFLGIIQIDSSFLGLGLLLISIATATLFLGSFYNFYFAWIPKKISADFSSKTQAVNLAEFLDIESAEAVMEARRKPVVLFLALLKNKRVLYILARAGVDINKIVASFQNARSPKLLETVKVAADFAIKEKHEQIQIGDLFYGLAQTDDFLKKVFSDLSLDAADIANIVYWENEVLGGKKKGRGFLVQHFLQKPQALVEIGLMAIPRF